MGLFDISLGTRFSICVVNIKQYVLFATYFAILLKTKKTTTFVCIIQHILEMYDVVRFHSSILYVLRELLIQYHLILFFSILFFFPSIQTFQFAPTSQLSPVVRQLQTREGGDM